MKNRFRFSRLLRSITLFPIFVILYSCEPIANHFDDVEDAIMYRASTIKELPSKKTVKVMTWNIRFGVARLNFFGDGCGDRVIFTGNEVTTALEGIAKKISLF